LLNDLCTRNISQSPSDPLFRTRQLPIAWDEVASPVTAERAMRKAAFLEYETTRPNAQREEIEPLGDEEAEGGSAQKKAKPLTS
jgi:hypothetical protein